MAKYSDLSDVNDDASLTIEEAHLLKADIYVDASLIARNITPSELTLPQPLLTELAVNIAFRLACIEQAVSNDRGESPLIARAREYQKIVDMLLEGLNRQSVGLSLITGTGFGSFTLGRA